MKRRLFRIVILLVIVCGWYLFFPSKKPASKLNSPSAQVSTSSQTESFPVTTVSNSPPPSSIRKPTLPPSLADKAGEVIPETTPPANVPAETALRNVERSVRQYGAMFGGNPVGTNPEITSQLGGDNPRHINFIDAQAGMRTDNNGQLIDAWGTPYFFHQLSGTEMEIHSAGPDKIMWTSDDLVIK